jgi:hypothetical protein
MSNVNVTAVFIIYQNSRVVIRNFTLQSNSFSLLSQLYLFIYLHISESIIREGFLVIAIQSTLDFTNIYLTSKHIRNNIIKNVNPV